MLYLFPFFLVLYETCSYLSNDAYLPSLPVIAREFGTQTHVVQLSITSWYLGSGMLQWIIGPLADRFGRRPVLLSGALVFMLSTLACSLSQSIHALIFFRLIEGATLASLFIAGYATIHELFSFEKAIHVLALMSSITILAPSFGPLMGALILNLLNWRWIFGILALLSVIFILGLRQTMPETLKQPVQPAPKIIWQNYKALLSNPIFMFRNGLVACLFAALISWITAGPFLLMDYYHYSAWHFSTWQALIFGSFIFGTQLTKPLMRIFSISALTHMGLALCGLGATYGLAMLHYSSSPQAIHCLVTMTLVAGGAGIIFPIFNRLAIEASDAPMGFRIALGSMIFCLFGTGTSFIISQTHLETPGGFSNLVIVTVLAAILCVKKSRVSYLQA